MMTIRLIESIGKYCSQRQSGPKWKGGELIRDLVIKNWDKEEKIEISFEGVELATPSFVDESIGKLVHSYSLDQLKSKLAFTHINDDIKEKVNKSIELRLQQKQK